MKNCLTPRNLKMCDPILVTLLKMRPHYSQSSHENVIPSRGTSPLASYREVSPGVENLFEKSVYNVLETGFNPQHLQIIIRAAFRGHRNMYCYNANLLLIFDSVTHGRPGCLRRRRSKPSIYSREDRSPVYTILAMRKPPFFEKRFPRNQICWPRGVRPANLTTRLPHG